MFENIPDNYDLWLPHDNAQQAELEKRPICSDCGEHITQDKYYEIDGKKICPECLEYFYEKEIEE